MKEKIFANKLLTIAFLIFAAAIFRMLPHPPNMAPIAAMALFGGAHFTNKKLAFAIPLTALFLTDLILGFHNTMWAVYLSFVITVALGMTLTNRIKVRNVAAASVASSVIFFIITNLAFWMTGLLYPQTFEGLVACFTAALPFFQNTLVGDLVFSGVIFGAYHLISVKVLAPVKV